MIAAGKTSLWSDRSFLLLWFAQAASIAGGQIRMVVLPVVMFQLTQSASLTALLVTVQAAPYLLFGLIAGAVSDRVNRRVVMVGSDVVSAGAIASIPAAMAFEIHTPAVLFGAAAATGTAFVWHDSALFGSLPTIVGGKEKVVAAYSVLISTQQVLQLVTTAGAGVLIATMGAAEALWIDSACYLVSAAAILVIPRRLTAQQVGGPRSSLRSDIGEGLRYVRGHRIIWPLTASGFGSALAGGAVVGLVVVFGVEQLGLEENDPRLGWLFTALAAGGLVAGICLPVLVKKVSPTRLSIFGLAAMTGILLLIAGTGSFTGAAGLFIGWGLLSTLVITNGIALRQQLTPDRLQGRVNVTARMIAYGGAPFGAAIGGFIASHAGIQMALMVMTGALAVSTVYAWRSPLWTASGDDLVTPSAATATCGESL